jgi:hypothetical protein
MPKHIALSDLTREELRELLYDMRMVQEEGMKTHPKGDSYHSQETVEDGEFCPQKDYEGEGSGLDSARNDYGTEIRPMLPC